jgi:cytochrome c554/c'-like protein
MAWNLLSYRADFMEVCMKRTHWLFAFGTGVLMIAGGSLLTHAADAPAHAYVGAEKCKMCHNSPAKGAQYTKWTESKHAKAYATLGTEEAKKAGAAKGIADPQKAPECLKCHVTGYGAPADKLTDKWKMEEGVGCEACHGPGGDYWKMEVMKDVAKATAAGMTTPNEAFCKTCHNPESPSYKPFDFAAYSAKIAHPNPQKAAK